MECVTYLFKKGALLMNNLKILSYLPKRKGYIVVLLGFLPLFHSFHFHREFLQPMPANKRQRSSGAWCRIAPSLSLVNLLHLQRRQQQEDNRRQRLGQQRAAVEEEEAGPVQYRAFFGIDSRLIVWIVSELHLMFAAFVLGVPIFAVIVEIVGFKGAGYQIR